MENAQLVVPDTKLIVPRTEMRVHRPDARLIIPSAELTLPGPITPVNAAAMANEDMAASVAAGNIVSSVFLLGVVGVAAAVVGLVDGRAKQAAQRQASLRIHPIKGIVRSNQLRPFGSDYTGPRA